jgi:GINS complex subunit 3
MQDIEEGQHVELPLWLAEKLADSKLVSVELPRNFSKKVRDSLQAAPETVRLREKSPHFYEVGLRLAQVSIAEDASRLPAAIQATLAKRVNMILMKSQNSASTDPSRFVEGLTDFEQRIFWFGFKHAKEQLKWRQGKSAEIKAPGM